MTVHSVTAFLASRRATLGGLGWHTTGADIVSMGRKSGDRRDVRPPAPLVPDPISNDSTSLWLHRTGAAPKRKFSAAEAKIAIVRGGTAYAVVPRIGWARDYGPFHGSVGSTLCNADPVAETAVERAR